MMASKDYWFLNRRKRSDSSAGKQEGLIQQAKESTRNWATIKSWR
jgi:hypothetical protein